MNEALFTFTHDTKKKVRKSSLQWLFTDLANGNEIRRYSDKRAAGVSNNDNKKLNDSTVETGKRTRASTGSESDGLLGSLLMESFSASAFFELLPAFFQTFNISAMVECADEFMTDRYEAAQLRKEPELTYYPL